MTQSQPPLRRLDRPYLGIQYLRALAALMVLTMHAFDATALPFGILGTGVDLFFVLSGFLMVAITDQSTRPREFLRARFYRIVPLYWLVTTISIIMLWGGVSWRSPIPFWHLAHYTHDVPLDLILASYAFIPWWNEGAQRLFPVVPLGWTLNLEVLFYLLIGASMLFARRLQFPLLVLALGTLAIVGLTKLRVGPPLSGWSDPVVLEFLIGAWIGIVWQKRKNLWLAFAIATLAFLALSVVPLYAGTYDRAIFRYAFGLPYAALLIFVIQLEEGSNGIWRQPVLVFLGNASYAIYLVQFPVQLTLTLLHVERGALFALYMIAFTLLFAAILHHFVEMPLMRLRSHSMSGTDADPR